MPAAFLPTGKPSVQASATFFSSDSVPCSQMSPQCSTASTPSAAMCLNMRLSGSAVSGSFFTCESLITPKVTIGFAAESAQARRKPAPAAACEERNSFLDSIIFCELL